MNTKTTQAKSLRRNPTEAEKALWLHLRANRLDGHHFRRQSPVGDYITDYLRARAKLVIEIDGGQHAIDADQDANRTAILQSRGYTVLRFWNHDVLGNTEGVVEEIRRTLLIISGG